MKIGILCYPTYGGSGAVATELGLQLADRGHEVHFVSYAQPFRLGHFRERVFFHEVEMEDYPLFEHPPYSLALAVAIDDTARKEGLDLIHVHYAIPHAASAWVAREMMAEERDLPIVTTLHGTDITLVGLHPVLPLHHPLLDPALPGAHGGLRSSSRRRRSGTSRCPGTASTWSPTSSTPRCGGRARSPATGRRWRRAARRSSCTSPTSGAVKRVEDVVEVFARICRKVPARLVFVGDGPERPRALDRAEELGVRPQVLFLGKHASVDELLACADVFLLPSESESFGLAALEAMASRRAGGGVAAWAGSPRSWSTASRAILYPVGDVDDMADAAVELLTNPRTAHAHGRGRAAQSPRSASARRPSCRSTRRIYERILNGGGR